MRSPIYFFSIILVLASLMSCGSGRTSELEAIETLISTNPDSALVKLKAFPTDSLDKADLNLYNLLLIKATDKCYIRHTTDSVSSAVLTYYSKHKSDPHYIDALYYSARVHADLGDYPTALSEFHTLLDLLPNTPENYDMRGNVLSQTGRLLINIRLNEEAIVCMREVVEMEREQKDSLNLMYDLELLGKVLTDVKAYDEAEGIFVEALELSKKVEKERALREVMYIADIKDYKGKGDSALNLIRGIPEKIVDRYKPIALCYAADIYKTSGIYDTAYAYAHQLIQLNDPTQNKSAHSILLAKGVRDFIPPDSLYYYIDRYRKIYEDFIRKNGDRATLLEQSRYNYSVHEKARRASEKSKTNLLIVTYVIISLLMLSLIIVLFLKLKNHKYSLQLYEALERIKKLEKNDCDNNTMISSGNSVCPNDSDIVPADCNSAPSADHTESDCGTDTLYRESLKQKYISLLIEERTNGISRPVSDMILISEPHRRLRQFITDRKNISPDHSIWQEIEKTVLRDSPDFRKKIIILTKGKISSENYKTLLLVKCGISPTDMSRVLSVSKSTISSRRQRIAESMFNVKLSAQDADKILRML